MVQLFKLMEIMTWNTMQTGEMLAISLKRVAQLLLFQGMSTQVRIISGKVIVQHQLILEFM